MTDEVAVEAPKPASWRESVVVALVAAVGVRLVLMPLAWSAAWLFADGTGPLTDGFFEIWRRWDARHLLDLAEHGYSSEASDPHATQWWPAFPLAVRALMTLGASPLTAGLVITTLASVVVFVFIHRLAEEDIAPGTGPRAVAYLALFPTSVFLIAPYTEPFFLAGATGAFYLARRERWLAAGPFVALAIGSRLPGLFVLAGLGVEFLRQRRFTPARIARAAAAAGMGLLAFAGYAYFLSRARGDAFYFVVDADEGWGRHFVGPVRSLLNTWRVWERAEEYPTNWLFAWRIEVLASAIMVVLVVWALAKREWSYAAFMGSMTALLLTTTWYYSHPRFLLMFFPAVLFLAGATRRRAWLHTGVLVAFAATSTLGVIVYTRGAWFF